MNITDPTADMLTRIRNANTSKHKTVDIPASKMKLGIAEILFKEGYIKSSYPLDYVGVGDGLAWFDFFDDNVRRSGKDGVYCN